MKTVFGIEWPMAEYPELVVAFFIILLLIGFYILLRYNQYLQQKKAQTDQLFLLKTKQMGLSNFQQKVLNGIVSTLRLGDPTRIFESSQLFESAIGNFLSYMQNKQEKEDALSSICRDIIMTYEKLYHPTSFRNPVEKVDDLENNLLLYVKTENGSVFIGKILGREEGAFRLQLFRSPKSAVKAETGNPVTVFLWRAGDAEYSFKSKILSIGSTSVDLEAPTEFTRGKEVRRPYVDVIIPCTLSEHTPAGEEEQKAAAKEPVESNAIIYKLHEDELVLRISSRLDYRKTYTVGFILSEFKIRIAAILISDRTLHEENVYYYSFRYVEISEAARNIIKKYISEHL